MAGRDFNRVSNSLYFPSCAKEACTTVNIINDNVMEPVFEAFTVFLRRGSDTRVTVGTLAATIEIEDDDGVLRVHVQQMKGFTVFSSHRCGDWVGQNCIRYIRE